MLLMLLEPCLACKSRPSLTHVNDGHGRTYSSPEARGFTIELPRIRNCVHLSCLEKAMATLLKALMYLRIRTSHSKNVTLPDVLAHHPCPTPINSPGLQSTRRISS
jgi:hypothetical protein